MSSNINVKIDALFDCSARFFTSSIFESVASALSWHRWSAQNDHNTFFTLHTEDFIIKPSKIGCIHSWCKWPKFPIPSGSGTFSYWVRIPSSCPTPPDACSLWRDPRMQISSGLMMSRILSLPSVPWELVDVSLMMWTFVFDGYEVGNESSCWWRKKPLNYLHYLYNLGNGGINYFDNWFAGFLDHQQRWAWIKGHQKCPVLELDLSTWNAL